MILVDEEETFTTNLPSGSVCWMLAVSSGLIGPTV